MLFKTLSASVYGIDAHLVLVEMDVGVAGCRIFCLPALTTSGSMLIAVGDVTAKRLSSKRTRGHMRL